jgi:hypothetical protein
VVTQFTWLDYVSGCEEYAKYHADSTYDDVGNAEEGVPAAYDGACADDYGFCASIFSYGKV